MGSENTPCIYPTEVIILLTKNRCSDVESEEEYNILP